MAMLVRKQRRMGAILICLLCLSLTNITYAQAQQGSAVSCVVRWQADTPNWTDPERQYFPAPKLDDAGNLYLYSNKQLLIIAPNGNRLSQQIEVPSFREFVPMHDYIVFKSFDRDGLYKVDFARNSGQPFTSLSTTSFSLSQPDIARAWASLFPVGKTGQVLACSVTQMEGTGNATYSLNLVDVQSERMTTIAEFVGMAGLVAWQNAIAGRDGSIYLQPSTFSRLLSIPLDDDDFEHNHIILKYVPQTSVWSAIRIPVSTIQEIGELVFIDATSSMYFSADWVNSWFSRGTPHITKVDSSGKLLWSVNVPAFMSTPSIIGVTADEHILVWDWTA
ncbi:MAG: hypothetical protein KF716_25250, partial [Anaerolineae bacterium]|nr:hypothetical protein [Anaerolineae bacterium]